MSRLAVLLRAVNVGGTGKLAMADFTALLAGLGLDAPRTLGAAGSAVVGAEASPSDLERRIEAALREDLGLATDVLARAHDELGSVLGGNPFADLAETAPSRLLVLFLKGEPAEPDVAGLRTRIAGPEQVAAGPGCLYIAYPEGMGASKLTGAVVERALGLRGSGRNWNTVTKLAALTAP